MNDDVREALPDLLNGRLSALDTATMTAHIESCADCRAELALLRRVRDSRDLIPKMNASRIAAAIPAYGGRSVVTGTHGGRQWLSRPSLMRIAAVAVLVAAGGWAISSSSVNPGRVAVPETPAASSTVALTPGRSVAAREPRSGIADAAPANVTNASLSFAGGTADLSEADLEQLVADLESMEALPSADPQSVTLTVDDMETYQ